MKERKTLLLARNESNYGTDAILASLGLAPAPKQTDAILCSNMDIQTNADTLQRENYSPSLSQEASGVGRILGQMTFTTELRASGVFGVAPRIGRLFKACGMSETIVPATAGAVIADPAPFGINASAGIVSTIAAITKTTPATSRFDRYKVTFTTGGAAAAAAYVVTGAGHYEGDTSVLPSLEHKVWHGSLLGQVAVGGTLTAPTFTFSGTWAEYDMIEVFVGGVRFYYQVQDGDTPTTIATAVAALIDADTRLTGAAAAGVITCGLEGTAAEVVTAVGDEVITLGQSGAVITITGGVQGSVTAGEGFEVLLRRPGVRYDPVSEDFSSVSLWAYLDGSLYRVRGARGTFSISGQAAQYPTISWTFTGLYVDPSDAALPSGVAFEESQVFKVELSRLAMTGLGTTGKASRFTFDMANTVTPLDDINVEEAFSEVDITSRAPTGGTDPEATKPSEFSPWARMRRGSDNQLGVSVGVRGGQGNQIRIQADRAQYTGAPFTERNGNRANDFGFSLARVSGDGDDEMHITFY